MIDINQAGWPDRYRPRDLESMALSPEVHERFSSYLTRGVISRHLILHGQPGFGKTSLAEILATKLYDEKTRRIMRVKATESGNVDFIRDNVIMFMKVLLGTRLVIFQEASGLTPQAAAALKVPLEDYADDCRVIFTTNDLSKLDEAIQSRCDGIEIGRPPLEECARVLADVLEAEGVVVEGVEVDAFTANHFGVESDTPRDMRTLLGAAQHSVETHGTLRLEPPSVSGWGDVWPEDVEGSQLLADLATLYSQYLSLPDGGLPTIALWTLFAWGHEAFGISPMLALISPTMRSGKSTVFDIMQFLTPRDRSGQMNHVSNLTPASLHHIGGLIGPDENIEDIPPVATPPVATLFADEVDAWMKAHSDVRAAFDGGYSRTSPFKRLAAGRYSLWYPKGLALIQRDTFQLPPTIKDRSIVIPMWRVVDREEKGLKEFRVDRRPPEIADLKRRAARWAFDHFFDLRDANPPVPKQLNDRAKQSWRPLFAIASVAGGPWPQIIEKACLTLTKRVGETTEQAVELIVDIHAVFESDPSRPDRLPTAIVLVNLHAMDDRPWKEMNLGVHKLSRMLHLFEIRPKALWATTGAGKKATRQGYFLSDFQKVFSVYVTPPQAPITKPVDPQEPQGAAINK